MDLRTFLKKNKLTVMGFSEQFGVPYATAWRAANASGTPKVQTAKKIEAATNGEVPASVTLGLSK